MRRRLAVLTSLLFTAFIIWSTQAEALKRVRLGTAYAKIGRYADRAGTV